jgi:hypothetical protein
MVKEIVFSKHERLQLLILAEGYRVGDILGKTGANRLANLAENPTVDNIEKLRKVSQWITWVLEYYGQEVNDG